MSYNVINLKDIYIAIGEERTKELLKDFECPLNKDVESFLRQQAIQFSKQSIASTFIITTSYRNKEVIAGYFAIANKTTRLGKNAFRGEAKRRFLRFALYDEEQKNYYISLPLIGQLGKNYKEGYKDLITGDELLKLACDKIKEVQEILGGRFVFLECEDKEKLKNFYESNGFVCFGKRNLEKEERESNCGQYLLQMLCDLSE